jgi:hypothetical protein
MPYSKIYVLYNTIDIFILRLTFFIVDVIMRKRTIFFKQQLRRRRIFPTTQPFYNIMLNK